MSLVALDGEWELTLDSESPHHRSSAAAEIDAARSRVAEGGGGTLHLWIRGSDPDLMEVARTRGMEPVREILQMRRPLPVGRPWSLPVRPFEPGRDEEAWIEVNNRAFDWHPEQSDMTLERLLAIEAESWFDPAGFLLHEEGGRLLGFCWTKVHADADPPLGEIFVIGVHPEAHGRGLGRQLVLAGLDHLSGRGLTVGMLYTEADNASAVHLYRDLGFEVFCSDTKLSVVVPPT